MTLEEFMQQWNSPEDCVEVHTSGSTGVPKRMQVRKRLMLNSAGITCDFLGLKPGDAALLCLPLDYIAGKMMVVRSIERGLELIQVEPSNHPLAGIGDRELAFAAMVPSQLFCSLQDAREREALSHIRHIIVGGGAISSELQAAIRDFETDGAIWSTYGMTETLSHIALRRLNGTMASDWYTPFPGVGLSLDPEGCLRIDAPMVHEGVLDTNDLAEIRDGRFRILGRRDNVICSGGIKLQIERMEDRLRPFLPIPFCITRRRDPKFGEIAVLLLESASPLPGEVLSAAFSHLETYEKPKAVVCVPAIPMTETGKIRRAEAEMLAAEGL